jgi:hypothetical protein
MHHVVRPDGVQDSPRANLAGGVIMFSIGGYREMVEDDYPAPRVIAEHCPNDLIFS